MSTSAILKKRGKDAPVSSSFSSSSSSSESNPLLSSSSSPTPSSTVTVPSSTTVATVTAPSSSSSSSLANPSSTPSTRPAFPKKPLWRRLCNCTNIFTTVFILYMVTNFYVLYTIAVPHIPPVRRLQDGLLPYWRTRSTKLSTELTVPPSTYPSSLRLYLALSVVSSSSSSRSGTGSTPSFALGPSSLFTIPTNESIPLLTIGNLPYDWSIGEHQDIHLLFHILRSSPRSTPTTTTTTIPSTDDSTHGTKPTTESRITGLKITCDTSQDTGKDAPNVCIEYAKQYRTTNHLTVPSSSSASGTSGPSTGTTPTTTATVLKEGLLVSLYKYAHSFIYPSHTIGNEEEYVIYESNDALAVDIARTLAQVHSLQTNTNGNGPSKNIRLSASIGWEGVIPDATVKLNDIRPPSFTESKNDHPRTTNNGEDEEEEEKKERQLTYASIIPFTEPYDSDKLIQSKTELITSLPYEAPKTVRYLWTDWFTENNPSLLMQVSAFFGIPYETLFQGSQIFTDTGLSSTLTGSAIGHWIGQVDLKFIMDTVLIPRSSVLVPSAIRSYIRTDSDRQGYLPLLKANPVRPLRERHYVLNKTVTSLPLTVRLNGISIGTWQFMNVMDQSLHLQREIGASERDTDDIIRLVSDTPLVLLALTFIVSFVHLLFDILAMKNDISFWNNTSNLRGISIRSLSSQLLSQAIIFLYLYQEGSSLLVLVPQAGFTFLLVWKILIAGGLRWKLIWGIVPIPYYDARIVATTKDGNTAKYDQEAIAYMSTLLVPLLVGYAVYALIYNQYTSWYSWGLSTAVSMVYSFGFILMTPQLWINYRLQSVPNLPWKVFGYRFFNTIIDDLFAAIIKMPFMHRVSVFRDDVVFIIYMIQRRMYPVDSGRTEGYDEEDDHDKDNNNRNNDDDDGDGKRENPSSPVHGKEKTQ